MIAKPNFRVIHVFPYTARLAGGHSNAIVAFMEAQARHGLDVCAICPAADDVAGETNPMAQQPAIHELDFASPDISQRAIEFTQGCELPIFHFHGYIRRFARLSLDLAKMGVHYVATSHGQLHYREKLHWLKKFVFINFAENFFHNASGLHLLTHREMSRVKYVLPFWARPMLVQPNVVETPAPESVQSENRAAHGIPNDAFVFAYLGRLDVKHKGLDLLVEAFARLKQKNAWLAMIGGDWAGGRQALERLAVHFKVADRVRFLGPRYGADKWKALRMADAFVGPSRWEAFGIAQAEAIGFGLPTIISDRMNLAAEISTHQAALTSQLSADALAEAMNELMQNAALRDSLSAAGRKWVRENCSQETAGNRFEEFYRQVVEDHDIARTAFFPGRTVSQPRTSLNVVHVFPYSPKMSGGHSNAIRSFIECQRGKGINALGIAPKSTSPDTNGDLAIPCAEVDLLWSLRWPSIAKQFGIERENTLVHFHSVNFRFNGLMKDLRRHGLPYVVTSHGQLTFRNFLHWLEKFVYLHFWDRGICNADGLHLLAKRTERQLNLLLPGYRGTRFVMGNLVSIPDLSRVAPAARESYKIPADAFAVLFLGRLDVDIKGLDLLIEAFSYLPVERFRLVLAGPDWKGGQEKLEKIARRFGCRERVCFPGPLYGDAKWSLLKMADIFVAPSRFEAFNISQAEAMACGLPVVTSTAASLALELRAAGAALVSPLAPEPLACAIASLAADSRLRQTISARGKMWVEMNCTPKRAGERFRKFYESVLEKRAVAQ